MSDFWISPLGDVTGKESDAFAKEFTIVPNGTTALAVIKDIKNGDYGSGAFIEIEWKLTSGEFIGALVRQKLKVFGDNTENSEKTRLRALNMLKLIYQLFNVSPKHSGAPMDTDLQVFIGKTAGILVRETGENAEGKNYNWVSEVHSSKDFATQTGLGIKSKVKASGSGSDVPFGGGVESALTRNAGAKPVLDDDVPF